MTHELWYKNAVIYCLNLETFLDSDGDGIGDFRGLLRRLDYLQGLGITTIWLMPFQPSPRRDHGYDIADYYGVDPRFGSLGDFVEFTQAARQRGIRVLMDLVLNHTSNQHPWFHEARKDPASRFRNWYVWSDTKPADADEGVVFKGLQESTWTYDKAAGAWYFHRFFDFQPDLNVTNPEVEAELLKIIGFWLQLGVSGFRVDAVPFLIGVRAAEGVEAGRRYDLLRLMRRFLQWRQGDAVFLAEANIPPKESVEYFGPQGDRLHMVFNFHVNQNLFLSLATQDARPLARAIKATSNIPDGAQWAQFLRNHDELDLSSLAEEDREKVFAAFAPDPEMRAFGRGIRRRLAPMLDGDRRRIEVAYSLLFTLPGTPVLRYGDEIGMGDDLSLPERESGRTPLQWSGGPQGDFTRNERPVAPVIEDGPYGTGHINVAAQRRVPNSLLNWMERMIRTRKEVPEIGWGSVTVLSVRDPAFLVLRYDWRGNSVVVLHNLTHAPREVRFHAGEEDRHRCLVNLLSGEHSTADESGRHCILLQGYGYRWFRCGGLDDLLYRNEVGE
ncbi:alpha-amylase family protein [Rubellimicrobium roseum]|uniref:Trehalose synthase n=1 Tax=Rubellimicrobium roseum TaxID=687525 RepID=A0A5C4N6Q0_9RHOB|nr:alpha-amylase family protein [Rubellimicrobium roseum]TNC66818.1 trehalose synthase [Rubellimicrobium roseum]